MTFRTISQEPLQLAPLIDAVSHPAAGAVVTFVGLVRDHSEGLPITLLEYHAYEQMAETELRAVVAEVEQEIEGTRVAAAHRIGELQIGDRAVVCAASAPHRGAAFRACQLLIDRIKERVPIWKREHGPDGPYWVGWK